MARASEYDESRDHLVFDDAGESAAEGGSWRPEVALRRGADAAAGEWDGPAWDNAAAGERARRQAQPRDPLGVVRDIPISISVELGRATLAIRDLMDLSVGVIVTLDREAGEPVDLLVNGVLIARGEVFVADGDFAVRLTEIIAGSGGEAGEGVHARAA
jgi:flagellar motor switch protein FliN/FliY